MKQESIYGVANSLIGKKDSICISVIVPVHSLSPDRRVDPITVRKAIEEAADSLRFRYSLKESEPLIQAMEELYKQIDFDHNGSGIGLFVSPGLRRLVKFHNKVKRTVVVSGSFEIRDWLYENYESTPYILLALDGNHARLYKGIRDRLEEISDQNFPRQYEDDYEYNKPSRGSSYVGNAFVKDFEKDKTELAERHLQNFLRKVDDSLDDYDIAGNYIIVAGTGSELDLFRHSTKQKHVAGWIRGNYFAEGLSVLGEKAWEVMKGELDQRKKDLVSDCLDRIGEGKAVTGLENIWEAALEGRGNLLLVEKDYSRPGFIVKENGEKLHLHPPTAPHRVVTDAVNEIMQTVYEKKGEVLLVENGSLDTWKIALLTRY